MLLECLQDNPLDLVRYWARRREEIHVLDLLSSVVGLAKRGSGKVRVVEGSARRFPVVEGGC
jgi:hypothetical protein